MLVTTTYKFTGRNSYTTTVASVVLCLCHEGARTEKYRENEQALDGGASNLYIGACVGKKANGIHPV